MKQKNLAIVIPAYKSTFLPAALDSIAAQTCKDFTLYVGDDCSPNPIKETVDRYKSKIDIMYHRFETNLGGKDLVAQWERCIDMTQGEEWLWLFSDDDVMDAGCVEAFYRAVDGSGDADIYHFDINVIDESGRVVKQAAPYPAGLSSWDFCKLRTDCKLLSFVVEYVYRRKTFMESGRFVNFDMAWGSDVATVTRLIGAKTLGLVKGARVNWRQSGENISPDKSPAVSRRKLMAVADYTAWGNGHFSTPGRWSSYLFMVFLKRYRQYYRPLSSHDRNAVINSFFEKMGWERFRPMAHLPFYLIHLFRRR